MTPPRPPSSDQDLVERFDAAFVELLSKQEQLEAALARYHTDTDGPDEFVTDQDSADPDARNRAELVHANFERSHQQLMDLVRLGAKLAQRKGLISEREKNERYSSWLAREPIISVVDAA